MAIRFIDLCSGIGGFHSGLMATGHFECVGHAEIDPNTVKAYKAIYGAEGGKNYAVSVPVITAIGQKIAEINSKYDIVKE